jgi:membrane protein DedA with SNARE-associated domain
MHGIKGRAPGAAAQAKPALLQWDGWIVERARVTSGIRTVAPAAAKVASVNWTRFAVRASVVGAIVAAVAVFFAIGFRKVPPASAGAEPAATQTR